MAPSPGDPGGRGQLPLGPKFVRRLVVVRVRLALVSVVAAVFLGFGASSAAADVPEGWPTAAAFYYPGSTGVTGWSRPPLFDLSASDQSGNRLSVHVSEAWQGPYAKITYRFTPTYVEDSSAIAVFDLSAICLPWSGSGWFDGPVIRTERDFNGRTPAVQPFGPDQNQCGGSRHVGWRLSVGTRSGNSQTVVPYDSMAWDEDGAITWDGPSGLTFCRSIFGLNFTSSSSVDYFGRTVHPADFGCTDDPLTDPGDPVADAAEDDSVNFSVVCAGPPEFSLTEFGTLGPWIGHYASCLFDPVGWDPGGRIATALEASPISSVAAATSGLNQVQLTGACGVLSSGSILGTPLAVNTCTWPVYAGARTVIGLGFMIAAGFTVLSMLVSALGIEFNNPMVARSLYTGD